jgi:uncharacterized membrane protein SpoIIM required for sporulation
MPAALLDTVVFEQLYPPQLLLRRPLYAFLLGTGYSVLGIGLALLLFPEDPALIAVAITSILFLPSLGRLSELVERQEAHGKETILSNAAPIIKVYLAAFFGIFLTFIIFSLGISSLAANVLFQRQLGVLYGSAAFTLPLLREILANNLLVFFLCFSVSLLAGNGAIFLIAWNASVWGTIFGSIARAAAASIEGSPAIILLVILTTVLPHVILEILAYIAAVVSGTVISDGIVRERLTSGRLHRVLLPNLLLFGIGLGTLILAAAVETFVLDNIGIYAKIAALAFGG